MPHSILVVEDNDMNMQLVEYLLEEAGCDGYISRSIDVKTFIPSIRRYLPEEDPATP